MDKFFFVTVTLLLPIGFLGYALARRRLKPLLFGVLAFVISQIVLRIPLLNYIGENSTTFQFFSATKPVLVLFLLALSAGVAEELARWVFMRLFLTEKTLRNGVIFGLGHGGIEAFVIVGMPVVQQLQFVASLGLVLGGLERICAMVIHVCLSVIVLIGVRKRAFRYCGYTILLHTGVNFTAGYVASLASPITVEIILVVLTALLAFITMFLLRRNYNDEKMDDARM